MLATKGIDIAGKRIAISGFGNVAWGAASKATQLGAKVVTISGPDGYVYDPDGISGEKIDYMLELRASGEDIVAPYAEKYGVQFFPGKRPWEQKVDIALPCATQNELDEEDAKRLIETALSVWVKSPIWVAAPKLSIYLSNIVSCTDQARLSMRAA